MGQNDPLIVRDEQKIKWSKWPLDFFGGLPLLVFANRQKEGLSHQLHSESESVGEGITLGDAVHLVHAFLELLECFFLLFRERAAQLFSIPGYQLQ